jgi:hypothetical protein
MKYRIEKNVPIPEGTGRGRPAKYPFAKMQVGDSFLVMGSPNEQSTAQKSAHSFAQINPKFKFVTRTLNHGLRIWRVTKPVSRTYDEK